MRTDTTAPRRSAGHASSRINIAGIFARAALAALILTPMFAQTAAWAQAAAAAPALPPLPPAAQALPDVVATIDGDEISKQELLARAQTMRFQAMQGGAEDPAQAEEFLPFLLDALISERLVYADSKARGVSASEAEVSERVQAVIAGYGGEEGFASALAAQGLDREYVRRQVELNMAFDKVMQNEIVPELEIAEETMRAYYESSKEQMRLPASYKVRHIMKQVPANAPAEEREKARTQLAALREMIAGGAELAQLAKVHSDDERTKDDGGEMPWLVLTGRGGEFDTAVAALEVGGLSDVVETPVGLHVLQLMDRRPERVKTFEEASGEIRNALGAVMAREEIQRRVAALRASASIEILM